MKSHFKIGLKMMIRIISFSLLLFYTLFLFRNTVEAKNYDGLKFLCADEIGPKLEFKIPNFGKEFLRENLFIKIYYGEHRNNFYDEEAKITKKSSPIDTSYFYYRSDNILYNQKTQMLSFEFYPPSTLMLRLEKNPYKNILCWRN